MKTEYLLTLDDLYNYYSSTSQRTRHFSAKDDSKIIKVRTFGSMKFDYNAEDRENLTPVFLQACHTLRNRNSSFISEETAKKALPSFVFRPIVGYIHEVDGQPEFYEHNEGRKAVGVISNEVAPYLEYDEEKGMTYVNVFGYIFDEYSKAKEILEREKECRVSVELCIRECTFNAKEKVLYIEDFFFDSVCILGKTPEGKTVEEGMRGSNITLQDFFAKENENFSSDEAKSKLFEILEELNENLSSFNNNYTLGKEENQKVMDKFEELLDKYNKTVDDITFEHDGLDDEALEAKFLEVFGEVPTKSFDDDNGDGDADGSDGDNDGDSNASDNTDEDPAGTDEDPDTNPEPETPETPEVQNPVPQEANENAAVGDDDELKKKKNDSFVRTYELSHDEIRCGLYALISEESWIQEIYDNYFIYQEYNESGFNYYGQKYSKNGDELSLDGERYEVFSMWLTAEEKAYVDVARANYDAVSKELDLYKSEPEKLEILNHSDYVRVANTEEFKELKEHDTYFNLSVDEIRKRADEILLKYAKNSNFSMEIANSGVKSKPIMTVISTGKGNDSRYGGAFAKRRRDRQR